MLATDAEKQPMNITPTYFIFSISILPEVIYTAKKHKIIPSTVLRRNFSLKKVTPKIIVIGISILSTILAIEVSSFEAPMAAV